MEFINKDFDNTKEFTLKRNMLLIEYKNRERKAQFREKKRVLTLAYDCVVRARSMNALKSCKKFEDANMEKLYTSFADNPRLKNLIEKDELIDRYEIRYQMAIVEGESQKAEIFSKTLQCFKISRSKHDIYSCKKNEKNRIIDLIKS